MGVKKRYNVAGREIMGQELEFETERENWNTYILEDGTKLRLKAVALVLSTQATVIKLSVVAPTLRQFAAYMISSVPEVEYVLTTCDEKNRMLRVFSVIDAFDATIREKIYAKEGQVIDEFETFNFEFNIISRRGRSLSECITDPGVEVTFKRI